METFLEKRRETMRLKHFTYRTGQAYPPVIERFAAFHDGKTHPRDLEPRWPRDKKSAR